MIATSIGIDLPVFEVPSREVQLESGGSLLPWKMVEASFHVVSGGSLPLKYVDGSFRCCWKWKLPLLPSTGAGLLAIRRYVCCYKTAPRGEAKSRPLRSLKEESRTKRKAGRGRRTLMTWCNRRLAKAKSSVVTESTTAGPSRAPASRGLARSVLASCVCDGGLCVVSFALLGETCKYPLQ